MENIHKAYQDLPIKPHGSRIINHIGGNVTGNETPTANPVVESVSEVAVEDETGTQDSPVEVSADNSDETTETESQQLQGPAIEIQADVDGNVLEVTEPEISGVEADTVVADEVQEIEPPVTKKKGIK